jgi:rod shape determining protein RodA
MTPTIRASLAPRTLAEKLWRVPWPVILLVAAIGGVGIAALYSVAGGSFEPWAERHALRLALGIALLLALAVVPLRLWLSVAYPAYAAALALLILVPLVGSSQMGARRWLSFAGASFQPAEVMKIALVLALARYYQWLPPERVSRPNWVAVPLLLILVPAALVMKQPDLGTAVLLAATGLGLMLLAGVHLLYFASGGAAIAALLPLIWVNLYDYQRKRVLTFLDPDRDPLGAGYHILQSKIALGSGGLNGKGFMAGTQSQLNFLPEKHTDFIFTTFAEEMGFAGSATLLLLYAMLITALLITSLGVRNTFSRLLAAGAAVLFGLHVMINIAMVTGLVPVVGVPLPLVSYGGTSMTTLLIAIGLAMCAHVHRGEHLRREDLGRL